MHPLTGLLCLIALAAGLASASPAALALATLVLVAVQWRRGLPGATWWHACRRLRWILVSLLILYGWFTPGVPVWPGMAALSPSVAGLRLGLMRVWMLVVMAVAARFVMAAWPREALIGALYRLTRPLARLGLSPERFCLRLVLTLEYAVAARDEIRFKAIREQRGSPVHRAVVTVERYLNAAARRAERAPTETIAVPERGWPPPREWFYPPVMLAVLLVLARVVS